MNRGHIYATHAATAGPYLDTGHAAIVITPTDVVVRSGITITQLPTPAGLLSGPAQLLDWAATFGREVTLVVWDLGLPRDALRPMATHAGWTVPPLREADSWTPCKRETDGHVQAVYLCVIAWMVNADPMLDGGSQHIATRLWDWYATTGVAYRYSPGASALAGLVASNLSARRRLQDPATADYWQPPGNITDLRYAPRRMPAGTLHRWDMRNAYLAAAAAAELPTRQLQHTGNDYGEDVVGYFRVRPGDRPLGGLGKPDRQGCIWVTHSMLELLQPIEVVDSWTSEDHARFLRPWAERWRNIVLARQASGPQYKMAYTQAIGLMAVPRGSFYRPDWRHMIIDRVRWSVIRRIRRVVELTGQSPVRVDVDSVWYDTNDPGLVDKAIGSGGHVGHMRYEGPGRLQRNDYGWRWIPDGE